MKKRNTIKLKKTHKLTKQLYIQNRDIVYLMTNENLPEKDFVQFNRAVSEAKIKNKSFVCFYFIS